MEETLADKFRKNLKSFENRETNEFYKQIISDVEQNSIIGRRTTQYLGNILMPMGEPLNLSDSRVERITKLLEEDGFEVSITKNDVGAFPVFTMTITL
jgi:ABC-type sulfate transport system substrate-binding protein